MKAQPVNRVFNALASLAVQLRVANNPSFAHLVAFQLELGLYQNNHFSIFRKKILERR